MNGLAITGQVDDQHRLSALVPASIPPGPVTILIVPADASDSDDAWMVGIAREWADDLGDQRQDIYTRDDGETIDGAP